MFCHKGMCSNEFIHIAWIRWKSPWAMLLAHAVQGMRLDELFSFFLAIKSAELVSCRLTSVQFQFQQSQHLNIYKESMPNRQKVLPTQEINIFNPGPLEFILLCCSTGNWIRISELMPVQPMMGCTRWVTRSEHSVLSQKGQTRKNSRIWKFDKHG